MIPCLQVIATARIEFVQIQKQPMTEEQRGGARPGAGRKSTFGEPTKAIRVPESQVAAILDFVKTAGTTQATSTLRFVLPADVEERIG